MQFTRGKQYRVVKPGAHLDGMQPIRGGQQGWRGPVLDVGTILTCDGRRMTFGDGVPRIMWRDENGDFIANDCEFHPSIGGMWNAEPDPSFFEEVAP